MQVDYDTMTSAWLALREAIGRWLFDPNVTLIDLGWPEHRGRFAEDELAIRIHVRHKFSGFALEAAVARGATVGEIPGVIGGIPTDVPQGAYQLHQWPWRGWGGRRRQPMDLRAERFALLRGGISISNEYDYAYGSLGGLVVDRATGAEMILSNWHVLAGDWGALPGRRICQPGRRDGGALADTVATYTRGAMSVNLDAAVATLSGSRGLVNDQLGLGSVGGVGQAVLGMEVAKSGRQTAVTYGRVTAIEGAVKIRYGYVERIIRDVVTIDQRQPYEQVSAGGDSGSWWLDRATVQAVGLHFAGCNRPERALAMDMRSVLDALNVDIVI